jgi:hypothetical protein
MRPTEQTDTGILYVGTDLGTSISVIKASNGKSNWVESYVGWPEDFIAMKKTHAFRQ